MEKKVIVLTAAILLGAVGSAQAQLGELHGAAEVAYQSKFVWRGFNVFGSQAAAQAGVDLDLYETGFGLNVVGHVPLGGGYVNNERWDYTLYYDNNILEDEQYATSYRLAWAYYNYADQPSKGSLLAPNAALQEISATLSWPKICPAGFVPSYAIVKLWPSESESFSGGRSPSPTGGTASGWLHILMLDYGLTVQGLLPETPEQLVNFHAELVYNDGFGWFGQDVDHDWSHLLFGVSTDFDLGYSLFLTPGLYWQQTMESSVNSDKDQIWATLGLKYTF